MSTPETFVWVTVDEDMKRALLTGRNIAQLLKAAEIPARWSHTGHGWVIPLHRVADLCTWCGIERIPYKERRRPA